MSDRKPHYLKPNKGVETPQHFVIFDTETTPRRIDNATVENVLTFGWAVYQRRRDRDHWCMPEWYRFESPMAFWKWVVEHTRDGTRLYLFCHNTNFDLPVLSAFTQLRAKGWRLLRAIIDGPPTILRWRKGKATIELLDTLNWWREKLERIGESVGLKKLPMPGKDASRAEWDTYCKRDVEVLRQALMRWWNLLERRDLGGFGSTIASQAMRWWRHKHMRHKVLVHNNEPALKLERAAYYGGRNECWFLGKWRDRVYYLDFTSAYLAVLRDCVFPVNLIGVGYGPAESALPLLDKGKGVIAEVLVETDQPILPRLIQGRLCFPTGRFWCCLTGPEILQLLKVGEIHQIGWSAAYEMEPLFTTYANECWQLRSEAILRKDKCESDFYKKLGNSLYGKFGQNGMKWDADCWQPNMPDGSWIEYDHDTRQVTLCRRLAGLMQRKRRDAESYESIPAIAAHVCAEQRVRLWDWCLKCGVDNVLYLDTDGFFVTEAGYRRVKKQLDGSDLGTVKLEGVGEYMHVRTCKDYDFGGKSKTKGVREKAEWIDASRIRQEQWSSLKGSLRAGDIDQQTIRMVGKTLSRRYTKGTRMPGGRVKPLELFESGPSPLLAAP